jgi:YVTN family beta-propeller protein
VTLVSGFAQEESRDTLRTDTSGQTNAVIATVPVGRLPGSLVASPDGTLVYVTSEFSNSISAIDTATNRVAFTIPLSGTPFHLAISPDSRTLIGNNAILLISTATKQISQTFATGTSPQTVAVSPDGNTVYVPNYVGTVTVIRQGVLQAPIHVGGNPTLVAFTLDGSYA